VRRISWPALLISNIAYFIILLLVILLLASILKVIVQLSHTTVHQASGVGLIVAFIQKQLLTLGITSVAAGYIAGRVSKRHFLLNGAMAMAVMALWSLYELIFGPLFGITFISPIAD
jgi:hypothetical protein